ncbi:DUF1501 domain-containing protein [Anatilimnocola floriformis]|uniref:DUF1501 domain-containing protein n=1 Tax=Anatilimnocola floriformis TaxID=2948575 RepID=UPI0020C54841|nr:DUF1501 domain-containing protein [Anatilimnocola floriformis]
MNRHFVSSALHTRRQWLACSGGAAASLMLPQLLRARENLPATTGEKSSAPAQAAIVIYLQGGLSHYESFDPKPNAPTAWRGEFNPIATKLPGVHFAEHVPLLAARADRFNVLRSVYVDSPSHPVAIHQTLTGWDLPGADVAGKNRNITNPSIGAWVSRLRTGNRRDLPPYVAIPHDAQLGTRVRYATAGLLGAAHEAVCAGIPPDSAQGHYDPPRDLRLQPTLNGSRLDQRLSLLDSLENPQAWSQRLPSSEAYHRQALEMLTGDAAGMAFDLNRESTKLREQYGSHLWGQQTILARRLVEAGVPFTLVNYTLTQHHGQDWDTHVDNFGAMRNTLLPPMDRAVSMLLDDLADRGLLDTTLVAVFGEFGRTPQINAQGGRDHWHNVCSVMLAGGGLKRGIVFGSSTKGGDLPLDRPIPFNDVLATIYHQLGIPTDAMFRDQLDRPMPVLANGQVIRELIA